MSLISSEVTAGEETPTEAPNVAISPSSLFSTEVSVAEAPAPPEAPPVTAPPRRPWWVIVLLLAGTGYLLTRRKEKR